MDYEKLVSDQRSFFLTEATKSYQFRKEALLQLKEMIINNENDILEALNQDLNKSMFEGYLTEVGVTLLEINHALKHLKSWMKRKTVRTPIALFKAKSYMYTEPYGVVLIMSPWNYPFQLSIAPLIGAIAAGNTAIIKVSPDSKHTSNLLSKLIGQIYAKDYITVVQGGLEESKNVLKQRYDYIFFTGSTAVGKLIMEAASKHLTPVTLELGGKSPTIVDDTANLKLAAKRIIYGKYINAGQTCIAPDYIVIKENIRNEFIEHCISYIQAFYSKHPLDDINYPKIINDKQHKRLLKMMGDGKIIYGGNYNHEKIEPTIITDIKSDSLLMTEEIFGPLLPIFSYTDDNELIDQLKKKEKPLALYVFSHNKKFIDQLIKQVSFGGATINDTLMHFANHNLPFGGVGYSGMGSYHGLKSFKTFSHEKAVVKRSTHIDLNFRYPHNEVKKLRFLKKIIK